MITGSTRSVTVTFLGTKDTSTSGSVTTSTEKPPASRINFGSSTLTLTSTAAFPASAYVSCVIARIKLLVLLKEEEPEFFSMRVVVIALERWP